MIKKDFIWLIIRSVGLFKALVSVRFIVTAIVTFLLILKVFFADGRPLSLISFKLYGIFLESILKVLIAVYLLFFGKFIAKAVHSTSTLELGSPLQKQNYIEILIRFFGVWCLWKLVIEICAFITIRLWHAFLLGSGWLSSDDPTCQQVKAAMEKIIPAFQEKNIWSTLVYILLYSLLAWYFLKHGKFFINLLNRLWLNATEDNVNQNPVQCKN